MFKSILEVIKQLFSVIFPPTVAPPKQPEPPKNDGEDTWYDAADLPQDTVVVTEEINFEVQPGIVITDPEKDKPAPTTTTTTTTNPTTSPTTTTTTTTTTTSTTTTPTKPSVVTGSRYLWCLDNGHAKETPGKRSVPFLLDGVTVQFFEYEFNRDIVKRMLAALKEKGIKTYNVVPEEVQDITLQERVRRANTVSSGIPKLFISIHSNAATPAPGSDWVAPTISGMETWYYQDSSKGKNMANIFQRELVEATDWKNRGLKSTELRQLYVLKYTNMPSILTENGFFNNEAEVKKLMRNEIRQAIADAHVAAILEIEKNGL